MFKRILAKIFLTIAVFVGALNPVPAFALDATEQQKSTYFQDYTVDYYLTRQTDGTSKLHVEEKFTAVFPEDSEEHGIFRTIPFTNQASKNATVRNQEALNFKVSRNGISEPFLLSRSEQTVNGYFTARIGDANKTVQGVQEYELSYDFTNVITNFSNHQELYWDTNGTGWTQEFHNVTARLHIEDTALRQQLMNQNWCYAGKEGSNNQSRCTITPITDGIQFSTTNLAPHENLTFDVYFQPHTFSDTLKTSFIPLLIILGEILYFVIIYLITHLGRFKIVKNRKFEQSLLLAPQYLPPKDLTVAESDYLYQEGKRCRSQAATLIELAVNHKIELIQTGSEWRIRIKTLDMQQWQMTALRIYKDNDAPFKVGEELVMKKPRRFFNGRVKKQAKRYVEQIRNKVKAKGYMKIRAYTPVFLQTFLTFSVFFSYPAAAVGISNLLTQSDLSASLHPFGGEIIITLIPWIGLIVGISAMVMTMGASRNKITITKSGLTERNYLEGLKQYISLAEAERLQFLQSVQGVNTTPAGIAKLYERLLPYAIIFNQEESWLKLLGEHYQAADMVQPEWYSGDHTSIHQFAHSVERLSSYATGFAVGSTFIAPAGSSFGSSGGGSSSSSSSSGGGGGGSSGGGGGGGGGGTW